MCKCAEIMGEAPFVSILIDCYNSAPFVGRAIESALEQDYPYKEVVVVDDGSSDGSFEVIQRYTPFVRAFFQENQGQNGCINRCVQESKGDILFFLDGDDWFYPSKVSSMVEAFLSLGVERKILLFHPVDLVDSQSGKVLGSQPQKVRDLWKQPVKETLARLSTPEEAYQYAVQFGFLPFLTSPTSGVAMTRTLAKAVFPLPKAPILSDSFFVLAATLLGDVYALSKNLAAFRQHEGNSTNWVRKVIYTDEFIQLRDDFLNQKLCALGKKAVIDYKSSIHSRSYYRKYLQSPKAVLLYSWRLFRRYPSVKTFYLAGKNLLLALRLFLKKLGAG